MAAKRSRIGRSTTSVDTLVRPPPAERRLGKVPEERTGGSIFKLASPVKKSGAEQWELCMDWCWWCKKSIVANTNVYMYSMQAFCSVECRERQINMDNLAAKMVSRAANKGTKLAPRG